MTDLIVSKKVLHLTKKQRLPKCYTDTEKIIRLTKLCASNLKTTLANSGLHANCYKKVYHLSLNILKKYDYIEKIIEEIHLLDKEKFFRKELAIILIYEILFGKGSLPGESKPVTIILNYKDSIMNAHQNLQHSYVPQVKIQAFTIPRYVRVHTLVTTVDNVIKDLENCGFKKVNYDENTSEKEYMDIIKNMTKGYFAVDFHFKDILVFAHDENLCSSKLYKDGHIFLQDKASYIPVHVLNPEPGSTVLDACAAPGMKSVHIASKMKNKGVLLACEKDSSRFKTLKQMIKKGSVKIAKLNCTNFTCLNPNDPAYSSLDYILLDPSCSGSGMLNRMDEVTDADDSKTKKRLENLAGFQIILLKHSLKFPSVKRVVYSTCSINEEENEYVVHEVLNAVNHSFKLVPAMPEWTERGKESFEFGKLCLRTVTEKHLMNGFFVAVFERLNNEDREKLYESGRNFFKKSNNRNKRKNKNNFNTSSKKRKTDNFKTKKNEYQSDDVIEILSEKKQKVKNAKNEHDMHQEVLQKG